MATFTMELWEVLEHDPTIETVILAGYPIFDEAHRPVLNKKILDHFNNREIGQENISMWRLALARKLNEIMPLYNQQYEISAIKFNQLETIRINNANTSTGTTASNSESVNSSKAGAKSRAIGQQFPQTLLADNGDYATDGTDNVSESTADATATDQGSVSQDGEQTSETTGFQGNAALMILQYRQSLVNVDMMIIEELQNLFMLVWANGDEFTRTTSPYGLSFGYGRY